MKDIPVTITYEGKEYKCVLSQVVGGGAEKYHLMRERTRNGETGMYYAGCLIKVGDEWRFSSQKGYNQEIADQLAKFVESKTQ
jgi:hypothetical protein